MKNYLSFYSGYIWAATLATFLLLQLQCKHPEGTRRVIDTSSNHQGSVGTQTCLGIVNGTSTSLFASTVLLLHDDQPDPCTGVFVGPNIILTAAHCIDPAKPTSIYYAQGLNTLDRTKPVAGQVASAIHPQKVVTPDAAPLGSKGPYPITALAATVRKDLAILIFATNVAPAVSPLAASAVAGNGTLVTLVGFGATKTDEDNTKLEKRTGNNETVVLPAIPDISWNGHIAVLGAAQPASTATGARADVGDSGGPLFVQNVVAGIFSNVYYPGDLGAQNALLGTYVNGQVLDSYADVTTTEAEALFTHATSEGAIFAGRSTPSGTSNLTPTPATGGKTTAPSASACPT